LTNGRDSGVTFDEPIGRRSRFAMAVLDGGPFTPAKPKPSKPSASRSKAMSQENVELVRQANEAFNRGDIEGVLAYYAEDAEFADLMNAPDLPQVVHGLQGVRQVIMAWVQAFDEFRAEIAEYIDAEDHVVCVTDWYGKSRDGLTIQLRTADVVEIRDGKFVQVTIGYQSRQDALEAAGLSEQDAHAEP
jgi:ketosteroid isomerase-like protein